MKIVLCCAAGMSTSLLVDRMQKAAKERGVEAEIKAFGEPIVQKGLPETPDVLMLGPQVRYLLGKLKAKYEPLGTLVSVIEMRDYGMMNGKKILEEALALLEQKN